VTPVRLTAVLTHPIQYYAPWFRYVHAHAPELALAVVYATQPTPSQQGVGFNRAFEWDVPLTDGHRSVIVRAARPGDRIDSADFSGLDVPEIGAVIADTKPDVVMITGWYSKTLVRALFACGRLDVPVLFRGDSHLQSGPKAWRRPLWTAKTRMLLQRFEGYLSPGIRTDEYLERFGAPEYRVFRVPHGVDNDLFARSAARYQDEAPRAAARAELGIGAAAFVALFTGKLVDRKRPLDVIRAAARTSQPTTVLVAGSGPLEEAMRDEASRLGVELKMLGFLNQTEVGRAYAIADCLVLPSDSSETWGLVVNEALATGLPVVVSDAVGCVPDLVRDGSGVQFALGDVADLASRLDAVRRDMPPTDDVRARCRAAVASSDFAAMTAGLVGACRSVIRHSPGSEADWQTAPTRVIACCGGMVIAGGLERMTFEVLRVMHDRGAASHAIVNSWENFRITPLAEASGSSWSTGPYWYPLRRRHVTPLATLRMIVEVTRVSGHLLRTARRIRPTHVLLPEFEAILRNWPALVVLRARGVQVLSRQGTAPAQGRFYGYLWRWILDPVVDRYVANSPFTRREILAHGIAADKVATIDNMSPRRMRAAGGTDDRIPGRVIYIGQIIPGKGLDLLLDAVAIVRSHGVDATLDVVGQIDGWEAAEYAGHRAAIRERAARADLDGAVAFLGYRDDIPALLGRSALHCCPSRPELREGFGIVVLEAKVAGVASVVTPSGNLPDMIVHGVDGWVAAGADAEAIAAGLEFFLRRPEELARAGQAARLSAEKYSEERFASAWAATFARHELEHSDALC